MVAGGAGRILNRNGERAQSTGNVAWALRAAELRLAAVFARPRRDELVHALAHLRAAEPRLLGRTLLCNHRGAAAFAAPGVGLSPTPRGVPP